MEAGWCVGVNEACRCPLTEAPDKYLQEVGFCGAFAPVDINLPSVLLYQQR